MFVAYLLLYKILHVKNYRFPCFKTLFLTQGPLFLLHLFFLKKKKSTFLHFKLTLNFFYVFGVRQTLNHITFVLIYNQLFPHLLLNYPLSTNL